MGHICKVLSHRLSNIKVTKYFKFKPWCNGVFSKDNFPRIKMKRINHYEKNK